jgi:hypothetical protein
MASEEVPPIAHNAAMNLITDSAADSTLSTGGSVSALHDQQFCSRPSRAGAHSTSAAAELCLRPSSGGGSVRYVARSSAPWNQPQRIALGFRH